MKTQPYTVSARSMDFDPESIITVTWTTECTFDKIKLGAMKAWMEANPTLKAKMPVSCTSVEGRHFIAPCILASTPGIAVLLGVPEGDGRTYATQRQAREAAELVNAQLAKAGQPLIESRDMKWGLSPARLIEAPKPADAQQPSAEAQLADAPW